jgi:hypothetical protein
MQEVEVMTSSFRRQRDFNQILTKATSFIDFNKKAAPQTFQELFAFQIYVIQKSQVPSKNKDTSWQILLLNHFPT